MSEKLEPHSVLVKFEEWKKENPDTYHEYVTKVIFFDTLTTNEKHAFFDWSQSLFRLYNAEKEV